MGRGGCLWEVGLCMLENREKERNDGGINVRCRWERRDVMDLQR